MAAPGPDCPVALTCGEPAGIGPEIAARAWERLGARLPFFWIGDPRHLPRGVPVREIAHPGEALAHAGSALPVLPHEFPEPNRPGQPAPGNAAEVVAVIARAVKLARDGAASAVCTAPIHKKALKDGAGFAFPGHTEYLAHLGGVDRVVMMLACEVLKVVPATIHIPLAEVPGALTAAVLRDTIRITAAAMARASASSRPAAKTRRAAAMSSGPGRASRSRSPARSRSASSASSAWIVR